MKKAIIIISIAITIGLVGLFASFKSDQKETTEYLVVFVQGYENFIVFVSINGEEFKESKLSSEGKDKGKMNYNPIIRLIRDYEKDGWEQINNTFLFAPAMGGTPFSYYYFKRKK